MANMVKFQMGTQAQYNSASRRDNVFYYTTDTKQFYLGDVKLSNQAEIDAALELIQANSSELEGLGNWAAEQFQVIFGNQDVDLSMKNVAKTFTDPIIEDMGDTDNLSTTNKTVVGAINEVLAAVGTGGTAAVVTMTESASDDYAKVYTLKQGTTNIGTINIPKDMVVESGAVEVNPQGQTEGTYIVLTLANATKDKIYVNVGTLVDIYKAQANAAQVQVTIDAQTREVSATIVAGSITATELAENAVVTAKIADGNVTKAKLAAGVQASLDKADTAMQQANLNSLQSTLEGKIATAKGEAIADAEGKIATAKGEAITEAQNKANAALNSAKTYTNEEIAKLAEVYDEKDAAATAEANAKAYADGLAVNYDAAGMAATAEANAKAYANGLAKNYATAEQGTKADTAVQIDDIGSGISNGAISILWDKNNPDDDASYMDIMVTGLDTAAYKKATDFDAAGSAETAKQEANNYTNQEVGTLRNEVTAALTWGEIELNLN